MHEDRRSSKPWTRSRSKPTRSRHPSLSPGFSRNPRSPLPYRQRNFPRRISSKALLRPRSISSSTARSARQTDLRRARTDTKLLAKPKANQAIHRVASFLANERYPGSVNYANSALQSATATPTASSRSDSKRETQRLRPAAPSCSLPADGKTISFTRNTILHQRPWRQPKPCLRLDVATG